MEEIEKEKEKAKEQVEGDQFGFFNVGSPALGVPSSLEQAIQELTPAVKQAFYAAANRGTILRGTWNGCAFNKAGEEVGQPIRSTATAAKAFNISTVKVSNFIRVWDTLSNMTDVQATEYLKECILKVGLYTEPPERKLGKRIMRVVVFKSLSTQMAEFEAALATDSVPMTDEAEAVLVGCR